MVRKRGKHQIGDERNKRRERRDGRRDERIRKVLKK